MSKRKSSSQALRTADMQFEDDDEMDQQTESTAGGSTKGSRDAREKSRVSVRAKKAKEIYDPSEFNGPVHKRKKEALEQQQSNKLPVKSSRASDSRVKPESPVKAPPVVKATKTVPVLKAEAKPAVTKIEPKIPTKLPTAKTDKKTEQNKKPLAARTHSIITTVPLAKELSKRIQARKQQKVHNEASTSAGAKRQRQPSVTSSTLVSDEYDRYDRASTVEFRSKDVPDVKKWTHQQVFEYFSKNLGFSTHDAAVFNEEEIDGEALMIMKRTDIVTTKFQKLKLGTALKMWSNIIMFQTGSSDPSQAWK